jgi:glutaminase
VFLSEKDTADRNFALAYYMKENKCFPKGFVLQDCLDFYFQVTVWIEKAVPKPSFLNLKLCFKI